MPEKTRFRGFFRWSQKPGQAGLQTVDKALSTVFRFSALQRREHHVPVRKAHGRNMIAEAACSRSSLSKKAGIADLFRQDTFPLRLRRGRGNAQGNLAAQGFRTRCACRRVRIPVGGLRPSKPSPRDFRRKRLAAAPRGVHAAAADGMGKGAAPFAAFLRRFPCARLYRFVDCGILRA